MSALELGEIAARLADISRSLPAAEATQPVTLALRLQLAQALKSLGDVGRAGELCAEILDVRPSQRSAHILSIDAAFQGKDFSLAADLIDRAVAELGDTADLKGRKADALERAGRHGEAIALLQGVLEGQPDDNDLKVKLARKLMTAGNHNAADTLFLQVLGTDPANRIAWIGRVDAALAVGDQHCAANRAERALSHLPQDVDLTIRAARAMGNIGRTTEAIQLLRKSGTKPLAPSTWLQLNLADLLQKTGEYEEATGIIQKVLSAQPKNPAALNRYIGVAKAQGDVDAALARCGDALKLLPNDKSLLLSKAMLLRRTGRIKDAVDVLQMLQQMQPRDVAAKMELARALMAQKDLAAAEAKFVEVLKLQPANRSALLGRVDIAEARGDLEGAMELLEGAHQAA